MSANGVEQDGLVVDRFMDESASVGKQGFIHMKVPGFAKKILRRHA